MQWQHVQDLLHQEGLPSEKGETCSQLENLTLFFPSTWIEVQESRKQVIVLLSQCRQCKQEK